MQETEKQVHELGEITVPSGIVLLIDFGLMDLWTHDKPPLLHAHSLRPEAVEDANNGCDFRIEGPDAKVAGEKFKRQPNPFYLYDIPQHEISDIQQMFAEFVQTHALNAQLVRLPERICPRERVKQTLETFNGAGEVFLHGVHAIALSNVPNNKKLKVIGRQMGEGPLATHWKDISLLLNEKARASASRQLGHVAVDMARLMFCDLEAAGKWEHEGTKDGLADFVFWGKDAARLAKKFAAEQIDGKIYGFSDKPVEEMARMAAETHRHLSQHRLVAAIDFRPHSDHWQMLKCISESSTESGAIDIDGTQCCGFMTSWGDGFFPVYLDLDENGEPAALRIDLGTEETINGMHMVNKFS
jgi:hypothetical protein